MGISIHTPLAGSDVVDVRHVYPVLISIHTPLAGSDDALPQLVDCLQISIHTPLAGSDMPLFFLPLVVSYFNPHSPCGERRSSGSLGFGYRSKFQSTLPLRGATRTDGAAVVLFEISIHTPLAGSDAGHRRQARHAVISIHTPLAGSDQHD